VPALRDRDAAWSVRERMFKSTRFEDQRKVREEGLTFDAEFLRWMLSDGAGAAVLGDAPSGSGLGFAIEWIELISFANKFDPCMYVGPAKNGNSMSSWLDYANYREAADSGAINLRQDIRMLKHVVRHAVQGLLQTAKKKDLDFSKLKQIGRLRKFANEFCT
jgi:3-oxoacyl-[acyl-carrier-protein] synthase-3